MIDSGLTEAQERILLKGLEKIADKPVVEEKKEYVPKSQRPYETNNDLNYMKLFEGYKRRFGFL